MGTYPQWTNRLPSIEYNSSLTSRTGQHLHSAQIVCPQCVLCSEVLLYSPKNKYGHSLWCLMYYNNIFSIIIVQQQIAI